MKLSDNTRFPYPVLSDATGDLLDGIFEAEITITEAPLNGKIEFEVDLSVEQPYIVDLIVAGTAKCGVSLSCNNTYFNKIFELGLRGDKFIVDGGKLYGRISVRPIIWLAEDVAEYSCEKFHEEFSGDQFALKAGSLIGVGPEYPFNAGRKKLAAMESIFAIAEDNDLQDGEYSVDLESEKIAIRTNKKTHQKIHAYRGLQNGRNILLNAVYLPVIMEVLNQIADGIEMFEDRHWFKIFSAKCDELGIKVSSEDRLRDSQTLLQMPFQKIQDLEFELSGAT